MKSSRLEAGDLLLTKPYCCPQCGAQSDEGGKAAADILFQNFGTGGAQQNGVVILSNGAVATFASGDDEGLLL